VQQGKVRYIGCSNFTGWQLADASWTARTRGLQPFVSVQNVWRLLNRSLEREVKGAAEHFGTSILPYFPLSSGLLTGKVRRGETPPGDSRLANAWFASVLTDANFTKIEALEGWAKEHDRTLVEVALSWLASQPVVGSVIAGATLRRAGHRQRRRHPHRSHRRRGGEIGDPWGSDAEETFW
jgi:aryl-alcohol dehydrogenase-like predicted oxidoreductase